MRDRFIRFLMTFGQVSELLLRLVKVFFVELFALITGKTEKGNLMADYLPYRTDFPTFAFGKVIEAIQGGIDQQDVKMLVKCAHEVESWALGKWVGEPGGFDPQAAETSREVFSVPPLTLEEAKVTADILDPKKPNASRELGAIDPVTLLRFAWLVFQLVFKTGPIFHDNNPNN